jgi:hypothetical protein
LIIDITGNENFIESMIFQTPNSPYCLLDQNAWNNNLKNFVYSIQNPTTLSTNYSANIDLHHFAQTSLHTINQFFPRLYLIGSTWIHFGQAHLMFNISKQVINRFGTLDWNNFGFKQEDKSKPLDPYWLRVTESQLRLTHLANSINLIDLYNFPDYVKSFNKTDKNSFEEDLKDPDLQFWLLRTCSYNPLRAGCNKKNSK